MNDAEQERFERQRDFFDTLDESRAQEAIRNWLQGGLGLDWGFENGSQSMPVKGLVRVKHPTIHAELKDSILGREPEDAAKYGAVGKKAIEEWFVGTLAIRNLVRYRGTETEIMLLKEIEERMRRSHEIAAKNISKPWSWAINIICYFKG